MCQTFDFQDRAHEVAVDNGLSASDVLFTFQSHIFARAVTVFVSQERFSFLSISPIPQLSSTYFFVAGSKSPVGVGTIGELENVFTPHTVSSSVFLTYSEFSVPLNRSSTTHRVVRLLVVPSTSDIISSTLTDVAGGSCVYFLAIIL